MLPNKTYPAVDIKSVEVVTDPRTNGIIGELMGYEKYRFVSAALLAEIVRDAMGLVEAEAKAPNVDLFAIAQAAVKKHAEAVRVPMTVDDDSPF